MNRKYIKDYVKDETIESGYRYTGIYYVDSISEEQRKKLGFTHLLIGVLQIVLVLLAVSINCLGNRTIYVVIPMECTLVCALNLCLGAYTFLKSSNRMERKDYEGSYLKMVQSVTIAFFLNIGSIIGQIYLVVKGMHYAGMIYEYLLLVALLFMAVINGIEWKWQRVRIAQVVQEK